MTKTDQNLIRSSVSQGHLPKMKEAQKVVCKLSHKQKSAGSGEAV